MAGALFTLRSGGLQHGQTNGGGGDQTRREWRGGRAPQELIPGFDFSPIVGVLAATSTPANAIERSSAEMAVIAKMPEVVTLLSNADIDAIGIGPADYNRTRALMDGSV